MGMGMAQGMGAQATANLFAMAQAEQQAVQQTAPSAPGPQGDAPAAAGGTPKFCPECGTKLTPGVKFCPECGNKLI